MSDWNALARLADRIGTQANPVTLICGREPLVPVLDNGGAQARCLHDEVFEGVITSDGERHLLDPGAGLPPYQKRVVAEKEDLDERLAKLRAFCLASTTFDALPTEEKQRLSEQEGLMAALSDVLARRIAAF